MLPCNTGCGGRLRKDPLLWVSFWGEIVTRHGSACKILSKLILCLPILGRRDSSVDFDKLVMVVGFLQPGSGARRRNNPADQ